MERGAEHSGTPGLAGRRHGAEVVGGGRLVGQRIDSGLTDGFPVLCIALYRPSPGDKSPGSKAHPELEAPGYKERSPLQGLDWARRARFFQPKAMLLFGVPSLRLGRPQICCKGVSTPCLSRRGRRPEACCCGLLRLDSLFLTGFAPLALSFSSGRMVSPTIDRRATPIER